MTKRVIDLHLSSQLTFAAGVVIGLLAGVALAFEVLIIALARMK